MVLAAGVVLAGGRSSRMGSDKAWVAWQGSTLLAHGCTTRAAALDGPVVVVRAEAQALPPLPPDVLVVDDPRPQLGPLQGLAAGLAAIGTAADAAFVSATDLPLLVPAVVHRVVETLLEPVEPGGPPWEAVVPVVSGEWQPLAAAYRTALAGDADADVAAGRLSARRFAESRRVRTTTRRDLLSDPDVAAADPRLLSFVNVNDRQALARAQRASRG